MNDTKLPLKKQSKEITILELLKLFFTKKYHIIAIFVFFISIFLAYGLFAKKKNTSVTEICKKCFISQELLNYPVVIDNAYFGTNDVSTLFSVEILRVLAKEETIDNFVKLYKDKKSVNLKNSNFKINHQQENIKIFFEYDADTKPKPYKVSNDFAYYVFLQTYQSFINIISNTYIENFSNAIKILDQQIMIAERANIEGPLPNITLGSGYEFYLGSNILKQIKNINLETLNKIVKRKEMNLTDIDFQNLNSTFDKVFMEYGERFFIKKSSNKSNTIKFPNITNLLLIGLMVSFVVTFLYLIVLIVLKKINSQ